MYQQFFGLRELPFELTPNPRFLFLSSKHKEALGNLQYAVSGQKGVTLLLGQAGTGKTTILRAFLASNPDPFTRFVFVDNPALTRDEFYALLAMRLGFGTAAEGSKAQFLKELESALVPRDGRQTRVALVFDEAQAMPALLLEETRLLSNTETETRKLLSVVLAGQPELGDLLEQPEFDALKQRVALRCELAPFDLPDTAAYIGGRLRIAGGDPAAIFTREAVMAIHHATRGIARSVSVLCDNALVTGFAANVKPVGPDIIAEVCRDFKYESGWTPADGVPPAGPAVTDAERPTPPRSLVLSSTPAPAPQPPAARPAPPSAPAPPVRPPARGEPAAPIEPPPAESPDHAPRGLLSRLLGLGPRRRDMTTLTGLREGRDE